MMAHSPGKPVDPTLHPRTRPEAQEFALRARSTGDWSRHDGKNIEEQRGAPSRMGDSRGAEIKERHKGDQKSWFQHDPSNPTDAPPAPRCPSSSSKRYHDKIYGKEEGWAQDNTDYNSPRPDSRLKSEQAVENKTNFNRDDSNDWFKHNHAAEDKQKSPVKVPKDKTPSPLAKDNKTKFQKHGTPDWFGHEGGTKSGLESSEQNGVVHKRVNTAGAEEYLERNRGSAGNWFGHHAEVELVQCSSPRVASREGGEIAKRLGRESENWYGAGDSDTSPEKQPNRAVSPRAREMVEKSRGQEMSKVLQDDTKEAAAAPKPEAARAVKPEGEDNAKKNKGMMEKYLDHVGNKDYESARPAPRVKPEAEEIAEKNKGVMSDCMEGYPDEPVKHNQRRVKPEAEEIATKNKGKLGPIMDNYGNNPPSARPHPRVSNEASKYAERNKGTLGSFMYSSS